MADHFQIAPTNGTDCTTRPHKLSPAITRKIMSSTNRGGAMITNPFTKTALNHNKTSVFQGKVIPNSKNISRKMGTTYKPMKVNTSVARHATTTG
ncbi:MAG TPA: hypothetical protein DCY79_14890 [Planctomycetaceae bacterium]|nr:hypothetical protein [Planctomycetaceae bacterium]